jgi:hypothetical protein
MLLVSCLSDKVMLNASNYRSIGTINNTKNILFSSPQQQHMNMLASEIATRLKITDFGSSQINTGVRSS